MRLRSPALLLVLGVFAIGQGLHCKRHSTDATADASAEFTVVRSKDGSETRVRLGPAPIPAEFPPGLPLYPGAQVSSTALTAKSVILALATSDSLDAVFTFYRKQPGYDEISDLEVKDQRVLHLKHRASSKDFQVVGKIGARHTEVSLVAPL